LDFTPLFFFLSTLYSFVPTGYSVIVKGLRSAQQISNSSQGVHI
jgi:hypothetical protein